MRWLLVGLVGLWLGCGSTRSILREITGSIITAPIHREIDARNARTELEEEGVAYTKEAFFGAAGDGELTVVKRFVEAGMSVHTRSDRWLWTALFFAARNGRLDVVQYLVKQGADVNATDRFGGMARNWAAKKGHTDVVEYLESVGG